MFWNRREIYVGFSMDESNRIIYILAANKISYAQRIVHNNMYYVYVHKKDAEKTHCLINNIQK